MASRSGVALTGKVVVITGSARGIGAATAALTSSRGARVAVADIDGDRAAATAGELGSQARGYAVDVTDESAVQQLIGSVEQELGPIDIYVNNAGVMPAGAFLDETTEAARRQIDINIHGVLNGCRAMLPRMVARGHGQLINVSSAAGTGGYPGVATYSGTKFFIRGFSQALRRELRGAGVDVSVVFPSFVTTELTAGFASVKGFKMIGPEAVATCIVAGMEKPRDEIFAPNSLKTISTIMGLLPGRVSDGLLHLTKADRTALEPDQAARADYERRVVASTGSRS